MMRMNARMQQSQIRDHTQGKQRSKDESSHCQDQSSILVDYGFHLINIQVPLILTRLDWINQESRVCCKSRAWSLGKNHPKGVD